MPGVKTAEPVPPAWDQRGDVLQLEGQIRWRGSTCTPAEGRERGKPRSIVSDNGTELTSKQRRPALGRRWQGLYPARKADAERLCRIVHRSPARRNAQRGSVPLAAARARRARPGASPTTPRPLEDGWMSPQTFGGRFRAECLNTPCVNVVPERDLAGLRIRSRSRNRSRTSEDGADVHLNRL